MVFENGSVRTTDEFELSSLEGSVSMSDESGKLLFYSNGLSVYNRNHEPMLRDPNLGGRNTVGAIVLPSSTEDGVYFLYSTLVTLNSFVIDMKGDNGLGEVKESRSLFPLPLGSGFREGLNAVKKCSGTGYWLITSKTFGVGQRQELTVWDVNGEDGTLRRNDSYYDQEFPISPIELIVSPEGDEICAVSYNNITLFDIDPVCGTLQKKKTIPTPTSESQPFALFMGACYSPSGKYLYASTVGNENGLYGTGILHQLDLNDPQTFKEVQFNNYSLYGLQIGPDGRMYIGTRDNQNGRTGIDRLNNPNENWSSADYENRILQLRDAYTWDIRFPTFLHDGNTCENATIKPLLQKKSFCAGDLVSIELSEEFEADSVFLVQETGLGSFAFTDENKVLLPITELGQYPFEIVWFKCGKIQRLPVVVDVLEKPSYSFSDTILCNNETIEVANNNGDLSLKLSLNESGNWVQVPDPDRVSEPGEYRYVVANGACEIEGTFNLNIQSPVLTELEGEYSFCEDFDQLVTLNAGKGFESYRWYPTEDTTEWIDVAQQGSYYVVVGDSRGCIGRGDAVVASNCESNVFLPNAFSPNGDGLNDVFEPIGSFFEPQEMVIYDRWGGIVYYGTAGDKGWDGTKNGLDLPIGVYLYVFRYDDSLSLKKGMTISQKVHLIR